MVKHLGKIILVNKETKKVYILGVGPNGNVFESSLDQITCKDDDQFPKYPARVQDRIVQYEVSKGIVKKVEVLDLNSEFRLPFCEEHKRIMAFTMAAKMCACGNTTNSVFKRCKVCAFRENKCVMCDSPLS